MSTRGILFVSHDAGRTGAPIALLHFLRWLRKNSDRPLSVLLPTDGELVPEFERVATTWSIDRSRWCPGGRRARVLRTVGLGGQARRAERADARRFAGGCCPGLMYVNSVASAALIDMLGLGIPMLTHVHELESYFRVQPEAALSHILRGSRQFIACSNAVKENLAGEHGVPPGLIETVHESIPVAQVQAERSRQEVLEELRIPGESLLVMGSGTASCWRKGTDLFVQLARLVCRRRTDAYFVWVGGVSSEEVARFEYDLRLGGIDGRVRFTGGVTKPADYLAAGSVFALTSREDPYPLVCLEAAALGKPIVCFADAGGMPEFVEDDCGFVVPYLDVAAMAERVLCLLESPECRMKMGTAARRKVAERHDISVVAPRVMEIIERTIARGESAAPRTDA